MSSPKVVLISGCSKGGIGFHLCEEFAQRGCIVYATARHVESLDGFRHQNIRHLELDVTSDDSVQRAVDKIIVAEGRIDVLVNNAGVICIGPIVDVSVEQVKKTFDANVFGALRTARTVMPYMASRKQGIIVNVGSVVGEMSTPWAGIYCASKAALHSITEVLQMESQPLGVSVVLLVPGSVKSNLADNHAKIFDLPPSSLYRSFLDQIIRRMHSSQGPNSMPTSVFAKKAVSRILNKSGPPRYLALGGYVTVMKILQWLPRGLALWLIWRALSA
ncbi:NAD-binding protein [Fomitiporia mediterranea MF3/22]|uniref:NAD-binding protein n=1 Tax=Fomitiporia mediterranea (strain MF3/22) TaxID=694068 RepID=UPI00044089D7|nr:NAD-binding protein [Fomitiporia mediterranea MF3/22]EJD03665.1 NAD-binding protein [Fomitiporia mediterranea MF3/22]